MSATRTHVLLALILGGVSLSAGPQTGLLSHEVQAAEMTADFESFQQRMEDLEMRVAQYESSNHADLSCDCSCSCCCPGWFASADYLNWQIERNDLGFAILDPAAIGVPSGGQPVQGLDLGSTSGARVGLGRRTETGWEVGFRYTLMRAFDSRAIAPGGGQVLAVQSSPSTGLSNADSVVASSEFTYDVFDLDAGHWVTLSDSLSTLFFGGIRYALIDHRLQARYDGGAFVNGLVDVPTDVDAFGGRIGTTMHWDTHSGLSVFGTTALSVMSADIDARRREFNAGATVIDASRDSNIVTPAVDLALGLRARLGEVHLAVGYEWTNWFNVVAPLEFSDSFNGGTVSGAQRDLGLHGFFASLSYSY